MTNYKGVADVEQIETDYEAGDCLTLEVGDWNGSGFSYKQNGNANLTVLVVESHKHKLTVIPKSDATDYRMSGNCELEFDINQDGFFTKFNGIATYDRPRVKDVEHQPGRSGYHKVRAGIEKNRLQD